MHLTPALQQAYTRERLSAREAQRLAQFIAWGPMVFQVSRLMVKFGILDLLRDHMDGLTREEIVRATGLSDYAVKILTEASLSIGTVLVDGVAVRGGADALRAAGVTVEGNGRIQCGNPLGLTVSLR